MFEEIDLKGFEQEFNRLGITSPEEQRKVLEFIYSLRYYHL